MGFLDHVGIAFSVEGLGFETIGRRVIGRFDSAGLTLAVAVSTPHRPLEASLAAAIQVARTTLAGQRTT